MIDPRYERLRNRRKPRRPPPKLANPRPPGPPLPRAHPAKSCMLAMTVLWVGAMIGLTFLCVIDSSITGAGLLGAALIGLICPTVPYVIAMVVAFVWWFAERPD